MPGLFYEDVLRALATAGVPHVIVGGVAVNLQGVPRFTADLDLAVAIDDGSLAAAAGVLQGLGLACRLPIQIADLVRPDVVRSWVTDRNLQAITFADPRVPLREVDLVIASPVPFEAIEREADHLTTGGITVAVAGIDTLIRMKTDTGRRQDESDVDALRRVREVTRGG